MKTIPGAQDATNLAPGSIDLAFVCATYHHLDHPKKILLSLHQALRPGGQLVIVDFDLRKDSSDSVRERAWAPKEVYFQEIEAAGFGHVEANNSLGLKDNFFAVFRRTDQESKSHGPAPRNCPLNSSRKRSKKRKSEPKIDELAKKATFLVSDIFSFPGTVRPLLSPPEISLAIRQEIGFVP